MVKCLTHGLRGFNGAVQRRLATLTVTMLISLCWQLSSEVELRRIFDVCKRWANSGSHELVKKNMVRYTRPHGRFAHCIFTLAVRQPAVSASCIEIYYFFTHACKTLVCTPFTNSKTASSRISAQNNGLRAQKKISTLLKVIREQTKLKTFNSVDIVLKKHVAYGIRYKNLSRSRWVDIHR